MKLSQSDNPYFDSQIVAFVHLQCMIIICVCSILQCKKRDMRASRTNPEGIPKTEHINNQKIDTLFEP